MKKFCVIGRPIDHSLSPDIFRYIFNLFNINAVYDLKLIEDESSFINFIKKHSHLYSGFNITSPFKNMAYNIVDELDSLAAESKSVNCISIKNSKLFGYNTDHYGFMRMLSRNNILLKNKKILILGYGGSARTIISSLLTYHNCEIYIHGRNNHKIENLIIDLKNKHSDKIINLFNKNINSNFILINCLPLKIGSKNVQSLLSYLSISNIDLCIDLNYVESDISLEINKHCEIISGLDMLIYQAIKSFDLWFDNSYSKKNNYLDLKNSIR